MNPERPVLESMPSVVQRLERRLGIPIKIGMDESGEGLSCIVSRDLDSYAVLEDAPRENYAWLTTFASGFHFLCVVPGSDDPVEFVGSSPDPARRIEACVIICDWLLGLIDAEKLRRQAGEFLRSGKGSSP